MSDLISKRELYKKLGEAYNHCFITWGENEIIKDIIGECDSVENKGEWSRHTRVESVYSIDGVKTWGDKCQCNRCTFTTIAVEGFGYYNFCPNCGADMRGET